MDQIQNLHHYTTLNALALILKNRTLRFNRLDRIDDVRESHQYGKYHLSRYLYVSCWTDSDEESVALWHMYSGMTGVRLSLPVDPFDYQPLKPHPLWGDRVEGQLLSILPIERIFGDGYMVSLNFFNKQTFVRKVEYLDDDKLLEKHEKAATILDLYTNGPSWLIPGPVELAGYKSHVWAFQREVRYILMIYPTPPMPPSGPSDPTWIKNVPEYTIRSILDGIGPDIDFFDIPVDQNALDNIKVTLAPLATESDRIIVDSLLQKYTKSGIVSESNLAHLIRKLTK